MERSTTTAEPHVAPLRRVTAADREAFLAPFVRRREVFLRLSRAEGSPLYVFDEAALQRRAVQFREAFAAALPTAAIFYAMKSNPYPGILRRLLACGLGLDVSSGWELEQALGLGAEATVFSGPGKTDAELDLAARRAERTTVLLDSFGELVRLDRAAGRYGARVRAGIRLTTEDHGLWRKFGIPLSQLDRFLDAAQSCRHVSLEGLQFHTSWNLTPDAPVSFLDRLGHRLRTLSRSRRRSFRFLDIGGGYWPPPGEWIHGETRDPASSLDERHVPRLERPAAPLERFAEELARALQRSIFPLVTCQIYVEPGRWISHEAMHLLLTVVDKKAADLVITDAGTNAIGWERFEQDYFPILNVTRPGPVERPCLVLGSLCTPHDVWGFTYCGEGIEPGDVLLIPCQGAYTYTLRQQFIKPLPRVVALPPS